MEKMTFIQACGMIYTRELQKDFDREIAEEAYIHQSAFSSNRARGKALSFNAETVVDNFKALCILLHREESTDERYETEKNELMVVMPTEDVELAGTYGWWRD